MYSRSFNTVKWGTFSQKSSIHWSEVNVLKSFNLVKWDSLIKKLQYIEVTYIYSITFNTVICDTCIWHDLILVWRCRPFAWRGRVWWNLHTQLVTAANILQPNLISAFVLCPRDLLKRWPTAWAEETWTSLFPNQSIFHGLWAIHLCDLNSWSKYFLYIQRSKRFLP